MTGLDLALWFVTTSFAAILLARLATLDLLRVPPFGAFAIMLAVTVARDIGLSFVDTSSHAYAVWWDLTVPAIFIAHAWASVSTYRALARLYPKIGRDATFIFCGALGLSILDCLFHPQKAFKRLTHVKGVGSKRNILGRKNLTLWAYRAEPRRFAPPDAL